MNEETAAIGSAVVKRAVKGMGPELKAKLEVLSRLFTEAAKDDARARYAIGQEIAAVQTDPAKYGKRAVPLLAAALGRKKGSLYSYATVASRWQPGEYRSLLAKKSVFGLGLTFSHLLVLAKLPDAETWLERTLAMGWSSRALWTRVRASQAKRPRGAPALRSLLMRPSFPSAHDILAGIAELTPEVRPTLADAIEAQEAIAELARQNVEALKAAIAGIPEPSHVRPRGPRLLTG